jgi:hypothetical protein
MFRAGCRDDPDGGWFRERKLVRGVGSAFLGPSSRSLITLLSLREFRPAHAYRTVFDCQPGRAMPDAAERRSSARFPLHKRRDHHINTAFIKPRDAEGIEQDARFIRNDLHKPAIIIMDLDRDDTVRMDDMLRCGGHSPVTIKPRDT